MSFKMIYLARRNPAIPLADWPRTWRSHAVFASQFPALGASIDSLFYCSRMVAPSLDGLPFDPPGLSRDYDGAAIVASASRETLTGQMSAEDRARLDADELRVFAAPVPDFMFFTEEIFVHGGAPGGAAILRFLARKPGSTTAAFDDHLRGRHAPIATRAADAAGTVLRHTHNRLAEPPPAGYPFDAITETWFATADDAARAFLDPALAPVARDLPTFCDMAASVTLFTTVTHRWPRA